MRRNELLLLDTQGCIAWAGGKLPRKTARVLEAGAEVYYSELSAWEVMIKRHFIRRGFTYEKFWQFVDASGALALLYQGLKTLWE